METALKQKFDQFSGLFFVTNENSTILYANEGCKKQTGFSLGEVIGKRPGDLWGGKMEKSFYQQMWKTIAEKGQPFSGEVMNMKKSGEVYQDTLFIIPVKEREGLPKYFLNIRPRDFGERKAFQQDFFWWGNRMKNDPGALRWILSLVGIEKRDSFHESVLHFLERELILPIASLYSRRKEDASLIEEAKKNPELFSEIFQKYSADIRVYFMKRVALMEDAEDLTQEVFTRAFRALPGFRIVNASYYTYLFHIAHNILVNYYRKQKQKDAFFCDREEVPPRPSLEFLERESFSEILRFLSPREREIMLLKHKEGLKIREIAQKLSSTENAIKLVLSRAQRKIRQNLSR